MIGMHFTSPKENDPVGDVTHVRLWDCGVTWKDIHTAPGSFNWARMDIADGQVQGQARHVRDRGDTAVGR